MRSTNSSHHVEKYTPHDGVKQPVKSTDYRQKNLFDDTVPYTIRLDALKDTTQNTTRVSRVFTLPVRKFIRSPKYSKRSKHTNGDSVHNVTPRRRRKKTQQRRKDAITLSAIVDILYSMDLDSVARAIKPYYTTGRRGYDLKTLLVVHLARYFMDTEYVAHWITDLIDNPTMASICRLRGKVPSESTMCRFNKKLTTVFNEYNEFADRFVSAVRDHLHHLHIQDPDNYPPVGAEVAIDASAIRAFSNPNQKAKDGGKTDKDATWSKRHKANSPDDMVWYWGYKMHAIVDANYEFPITWSTTTAKRNDLHQLRPLYEDAKQTFPWYAPQYLLGDKGYDSEAMHRYLRKQGTNGIIPPRKPTSKDGLYNGLFNADGDPTCMGLVGMEYIQTDSVTGKHLYRCRAEGCDLKTKGIKGLVHCDDEHWFDPDDNPRILGAIPRNTDTYKRLYRKRWSVERDFYIFKESRLLEKYYYRGLAKVQTHVTSMAISFLATMLAHLQRGDVDHMAAMQVRAK